MGDMSIKKNAQRYPQSSTPNIERLIRLRRTELETWRVKNVDAPPPTEDHSYSALVR